MTDYRKVAEGAVTWSACLVGAASMIIAGNAFWQTLNHVAEVLLGHPVFAWPMLAIILGAWAIVLLPFIENAQERGRELRRRREGRSWP
jgi:Mg/Co/Ni transporter MgtE